MKTPTSILCGMLLAASIAPAGAQNTQPQSGFGSATAFVGDHILVGEPLNQRVPGAVYAFARDSLGDWAEIQRLVADDGHPGDRFGIGISALGDQLFVAATRSDDARGAVYTFRRNTDGFWTQTGKIVPIDGKNGDRFGAAIAAAGDRLFVSSTPFEGVGSVHVWRQGEDGGWEMETRITGADVDGPRFGYSLAADGETLMIGSPDHGHGEVLVYTYDDETSEWSESTRLVGREAEEGGRDEFGGRIVLREDLAVIAADNADFNRGNAFIFHRDGSSWSPGPRLTSFNAGAPVFFGSDIAVAGDRILAGAVGLDGFRGGFFSATMSPDHRSIESMHAHRREIGQFANFGGQVTASDSLVLVSATADRFTLGTVFVYALDGRSGKWSEAAILAPDARSFHESVSGDMVKCQDGKAGGFTCSNVDMVSFVSNRDLGIADGNRTNDIWGWHDQETDKEYVIVARTDGVSFVDVTDSSHPVVLGFLPRTQGTPPTIWRDVKVYRNFALIVADGAGEHGVQVFDLTKLRNVEDPPVRFTETALYDRIHSAHNIVVNEQTGFAYVVGAGDGGETCGGASHIIDLSDPTNPAFAGCFAHTGTGFQGTGYTHDAQCVVYRGPDERYLGREICFAANENVISIADLTDKDDPVILSRGSYPNPGYTHQGWLTEDQRFFYLGDELDEINGLTEGTRTLIWDVAELDDPVLVNEHVSKIEATDHNLYIRGHYMYQSNYVSGLRVVDIQDPENPVEVGFFDTVSWTDDRAGYGGSWSNYPFLKNGVIAVTSSDEGVFFLKRSDVEF